jgi:hypothetical protein
MNIWMRLVGAIKRPKHWANAAADTLKMVSCRVHTDEVRIVLKNLEQVEDFFHQRGGGSRCFNRDTDPAGRGTSPTSVAVSATPETAFN